MFDRDLPLRAGDLVSLALGHGVLRNRRVNRDAVDELLASVGAGHLADARVGALSGGQQQLVRQAQALAKNPEILLADEPFLSSTSPASARPWSASARSTRRCSW